MLDENSYLTPLDIASRLHYRKRHWFHGEPKVKLEGESKQFGILEFDFGDEKVRYNIYIRNRDDVLDAAAFAIANFSQLGA